MTPDERAVLDFRYQPVDGFDVDQLHEALARAREHNSLSNSVVDYEFDDVNVHRAFGTVRVPVEWIQSGRADLKHVELGVVLKRDHDGHWVLQIVPLAGVEMPHRPVRVRPDLQPDR